MPWVSRDGGRGIRIRHHGPGSARSCWALRDFEPEAVLIEGPADADPLLDWVLPEGMAPPLALLAYAPRGRASPLSGRSPPFSPSGRR